jgi:hypothetical protein
MVDKNIKIALLIVKNIKLTIKMLNKQLEARFF